MATPKRECRLYIYLLILRTLCSLRAPSSVCPRNVRLVLLDRFKPLLDPNFILLDLVIKDGHCNNKLCCPIHFWFYRPYSSFIAPTHCRKPLLDQDRQVRHHFLASSSFRLGARHSSQAMSSMSRFELRWNSCTTLSIYQSPVPGCQQPSAREGMDIRLAWMVSFWQTYHRSMTPLVGSNYMASKTSSRPIRTGVESSC